AGLFFVIRNGSEIRTWFASPRESAMGTIGLFITAGVVIGILLGGIGGAVLGTVWVVRNQSTITAAPPAAAASPMTHTHIQSPDLRISARSQPMAEKKTAVLISVDNDGPKAKFTAYCKVLRRINPNWGRNDPLPEQFQLQWTTSVLQTM